MGATNKRHRPLTAGISIASAIGEEAMPGALDQPELRGPFGGGTLTGVATRKSDNRKVLVTNLHCMVGIRGSGTGAGLYYPPSLKLQRRGRQLVFDDEEIEDLADMRYGDRLTFALLSLLFPFIDLRNQFHVDHIFPAARFTDSRLKCANVPDEKIPEFKDFSDRLANLQTPPGRPEH